MNQVHLLRIPCAVVQVGHSFSHWHKETTGPVEVLLLSPILQSKKKIKNKNGSILITLPQITQESGFLTRHSTNAASVDICQDKQSQPVSFLQNRLEALIQKCSLGITVRKFQVQRNLTRKVLLSESFCVKEYCMKCPLGNSDLILSCLLEDLAAPWPSH